MQQQKEIIRMITIDFGNLPFRYSTGDQFIFPKDITSFIYKDEVFGLSNMQGAIGAYAMSETAFGYVYRKDESYYQL